MCLSLSVVHGQVPEPNAAAAEGDAAVNAARQQLDAGLKELDGKLADAKATEARIEAWAPTLTTVGLWISVFWGVMLIAGLMVGGAAYTIGGKLKRASDDADLIRVRLNDLSTQFDKALAAMELRFSELPAGALVGATPQSPPQASLDADVLVIVGDYLTMRGDRAALAKSLVKVGRYWRKFQYFDRSIERLSRALELDPKSAAAHQALARTHWNILASENLKTDTAQLTDAQQRRFKEALFHIDQARLLLPSEERNRPDVLYDLGAIHFSVRELDVAIRHFKSAIERTEREAQEQGREPDWDCHYALACAYARGKVYTQALEVLTKIAGKTKKWDAEEKVEVPEDFKRVAYQEPDFDAWFALEDWKPYILAAIGPPPTS